MSVWLDTASYPAWSCHHKREYESFERGYLAMIHHRVLNILVANNDSPTGNAKRFALTRNKEDQPDARILQEGLESIDAAVSAPVRNGKGRIVKTSDESRAIALRRHINRAERIG